MFDQLTQTQVSTPAPSPASVDASSPYTIGPLDPSQIHPWQAYLSVDLEVTLLVPVSLPLSLLNDPWCKEGYEDGYDSGESDADLLTWTVPKLVNEVFLTLESELRAETACSAYTWTAGFLLGRLSSLAECEQTLAHVGLAHLCYLLSFLSAEDPGSWPRGLNRAFEAHTQAIKAYRKKVRGWREQGQNFELAQRLALAAPSVADGGVVMREQIEAMTTLPASSRTFDLGVHVLEVFADQSMLLTDRAEGQFAVQLDQEESYRLLMALHSVFVHE
jgi:hypothetical protein